MINVFTKNKKGDYKIPTFKKQTNLSLTIPVQLVIQ